METAARQIVAFGGGGFSMESGNPLLDDYVLGLTGAERPRVCFLPSASGDADHYIVRFYRAFSAHRCEPTHISLFRREQGPADLRRLDAAGTRVEMQIATTFLGDRGAPAEAPLPEALSTAPAA
jgi:Peptidase family S51